MRKLQDRIALITGASRGIGAAVACRYAIEGAQVILAARTQKDLEATDDAIRAESGVSAALVKLDLRDGEMVDSLAASVAERFGRLDILVGNAATLGEITPLAHAAPSMWEQVIATNLTANWRLIRAFDPLLRASNSGRAILVTSGAAQIAVPYWGAYAVSKAGLEMLVRTYAAESAKTNVKANLIDPGAVRTRMRKAAFPGEDASKLPAPESVTELFVRLAEAGFSKSGEVFRA